MLLLAACGRISADLSVDNTKPVSDGNRIIYQMNVGAFTPKAHSRQPPGNWIVLTRWE